MWDRVEDYPMQYAVETAARFWNQLHLK